MVPLEVRKDDLPRCGHSNSRWPAKATTQCPLANERTIAVENLHSVVVRVSNKDQTLSVVVVVHANALGIAKFGVEAPELPPSAQKSHPA